MVKQDPVSVNWQSLFAIIPIVSIWAFLRIEKLRKALLYFVVIGLAIYFGLGYALFQESFILEEDPSPEIFAYNIGHELASAGVSIILIRKWSREWNEKVSNTTNQDIT